MPKTYLRRAVLATLGAIGAGTASASGNGQTRPESNTTVKQEQSVSVEQSQKVVVDSEPEEHKPSHSNCAKCVDTDGNVQKLGTFVIYNRSTCQRKVTIETTGKIALEGETLEDQTLSAQVPPKEACVGGFTGSLVRLDAEHGNLDISIKQRSEQEANHCGGENRVFHD